MARGFEITHSREGIELGRDAVSGLEIVSVAGNCAADISNRSNPRTREWYIENVLKPGIEAGTIGDGIKTRFDDRKPRFDYASINPEGGGLVVGWGITHYGAMKADMALGLQSAAERKQRGIRDFADKWVYFQRAPGASVLPISTDGSTFVGQRVNVEDYEGFLCSAAGWCEYNGDPASMNPTEDALRELREELGVPPEKIRKLELIGLFENPKTGELDFTFLARTDLPDEYFTSGAWKAEREDEEHEGFIRIPTYEDVQKVLAGETLEGYEGEPIQGILYSTEGALRSLRPEDLAA